MEVQFGVHLDVQLVNIGKDVDAFSDLSVQTLLECPLNLDLKAGVVCVVYRDETR